MMVKGRIKRKYLMGISICIIGLLIGFVYGQVLFIRQITNLVIAGGVVAYMLKPLRDFCLKRINISKRVATFLILIIISVLFVGIVAFTVPAFIGELDNIGKIMEELNKYFFELEKWLRVKNSTVLIDLYGTIQGKLEGGLTAFAYGTLEWIIEFSQNMLSYVIVPIVAYYFLSDGELMGKKFYMLIPIKKRNVIRKILRDIDNLLQRYIVSQLILCLVTTGLSLILFLVLGLRFSVFLAIINGVFNIVPYFGAFFGGVPAIFVALLISPKLALWTLIGIFVVQQIEGNIIAPKITGDSTDLHPLLIIILLIVGEKVGGIFGMIFIIPLAVIVKVIYDDINYYIF